MDYEACWKQLVATLVSSIETHEVEKQCCMNILEAMKLLEEQETRKEEVEIEDVEDLTII